MMNDQGEITRLRAEVAELRAENKRLDDLWHESNGWALERGREAEALRAAQPRPMAEAPRDGTQVLLEFESGIRMMGRWLKDHGGAWELRPNFISAKDSVFVGWLPLPAPTTEAK
jgi:hypothetical protein